MCWAKSGPERQAPLGTEALPVMEVTPVRKSTRSRPARKADFPLGQHKARGYWIKKVRGKIHYFGKIADDPDGKAALERWLREKDYLLNGLTPPDDPSGLTVRELANRFLTAKTALIRSGELTRPTFYTYHAACGRLVDALGERRLVADLTPTDFGNLREKRAEGRGPAALGHEIAIIRMVLKFAWDSGFLERPVRFGQSFDKPSRKTMRIERAKRGEKMFEAAELRTILDAANVPMRAFVLLGLNCAFGASDLARLPKAAIDLGTGWIVFPRGKTGIKRRCSLWPETAAAIKEAIEQRPDAKVKADDAIAFLTPDGKRWMRLRQVEGQDWATSNDLLGREFSSLLAALGLTRNGRGFYTLRHVFRTIADEAKDQPAAGFIMGHHDPSMAAAYRERISDARLRAVADHVRAWLFDVATGEKGGC